MKVRTSLTGPLVVCGIGVCSIGTAAAQPAAPPGGYKIEEQYTEKSPDGAITIEQYLNKDTDDWKWQFWVRRQGAFTLLDSELADYPAGFRFTNDLKWLVRMQKTGSVKKDPEYHISANLLKGTEENYRWLGVDWPQNRYLLIGLSGDADIKTRKPMQTGVVNGWRCRYDLQTGKFDVPPLFSNDNAKAVVPQ